MNILVRTLSRYKYSVSQYLLIVKIEFRKNVQWVYPSFSQIDIKSKGI